MNDQNTNSTELKELEHAVMKYLTTKRGGRHYRTFELMYNLIEKYKHKRYTLQKITEEITRLTA